MVGQRKYKRRRDWLGREKEEKKYKSWNFYESKLCLPSRIVKPCGNEQYKTN